MPLTLYVDTERWRAQIAAVHAANPGLVPVMKGNGYGFGNARLAAESAKLGVPTVAVGTVDEVAQVADAFAGDVLVLTPHRIGEEAVPLPDSVIRTAASVDAVRALSGRRVVIECMTSLRRHGVTEEDLIKLRAAIGDVRRPAERRGPGRRGVELGGPAARGRHADVDPVRQPPERGRAGRAGSTP
jgi:alanine racemase